MATRKRRPEGASIDAWGTQSRSGFDVTDEAHRRRVATAACYKAERRGFSAGAELDDWLCAEQEILAEASRMAKRADRAD